MAERDDRTSVVVTDVKIPFHSMVALALKAALAAIPALLLLACLALAVFMLAPGLFPLFR